MTTKTVLITGASRGLGLALARALAQDGWQLILDARGADLLQAAVVELAKVKRVTAVSLHLESADALLEEGNNLARIH